MTSISSDVCGVYHHWPGEQLIEQPPAVSPITRPAPGRNDRAVAALRIAVGVLFLVFAEYKVLGTEFVFGGGFQGWIQRFLAEGSAYPFMVPVLRGLVLPHALPFALLVAYGELALGVSLLLGLWVRPASLCGLVYMLALLFSANYPGPDAAIWHYLGAALEHLVLALCFAAFLIGDPERAWSVSAVWSSRRTAPSTARRSPDPA